MQAEDGSSVSVEVDSRFGLWEPPKANRPLCIASSKGDAVGCSLQSCDLFVSSRKNVRLGSSFTGERNNKRKDCVYTSQPGGRRRNRDGPVKQATT